MQWVLLMMGFGPKGKFLDVINVYSVKVLAKTGFTLFSQFRSLCEAFLIL
jgi:hypothetical protein